MEEMSRAPKSEKTRDVLEADMLGDPKIRLSELKVG
jgi:hypothetical protein